MKKRIIRFVNFWRFGSNTKTFIINAHSIVCPSKIHQSCFSLLYRSVYREEYVSCMSVCLYVTCVCVTICFLRFVFNMFIYATLCFMVIKIIKRRRFKGIGKNWARLSYEPTQKHVFSDKPIFNRHLSIIKPLSATF